MSLRPVIAGNWKMNLGPQEVRSFFAGFRQSGYMGSDVDLLLFPPSISFEVAMQAKADTPEVKLGVQNIHWEASGAFTGEISASMAKGAGATHVLIGHSERRHVFGETDEEVGKKVAAALTEGLIPVVCVGETLEERKSGRLEEVILGQLEAFLLVVQAHPGAEVLLAYETGGAPAAAVGRKGQVVTLGFPLETVGDLGQRTRIAEGALSYLDPVFPPPAATPAPVSSAPVTSTTAPAATAGPGAGGGGGGGGGGCSLGPARGLGSASLLWLLLLCAGSLGARTWAREARGVR